MKLLERGKSKHIFIQLKLNKKKTLKEKEERLINGRKQKSN